MKYNVLVGGIHIESSSFTINKAKREDFKALRGNELLKVKINK